MGPFPLFTVPFEEGLLKKKLILSHGIITYLMLSGSLTFDDRES